MTAVGKDSGHTVRAGIDIALEPAQAFDTIVDELAGALRDEGMQFAPGPGGSIRLGDAEVGRVVSWERGKRITLRWMQASWQPDEVTEAEIRFEVSGAGTRVAFEHRRWGALLGAETEVAGWFAAGVLAPIMNATAPAWLGDWITDRRARRPSGEGARSFYSDPLYHYPGFSAILAELALTNEDRLIEVGCGGGVLLRQALASGCTGAGVDHSPAMLDVARELNAELIRGGRLKILDGDALHLPFPDNSFTCATMCGVFGFITEPVRALGELHRVLRPGGRIVILGSDPSMRGTPAAPEPIASRLHFYEDAELSGLARSAGFGGPTVVRRDVESYARKAGIPEEHMPLFKGAGTPLLLARKT
jgi:SAM-dependent methyltransferase